MPGSVEGFCSNKECGKKLPGYPNAPVYQLPEEKALHPPVWYCSLECSILTRLECYEVAAVVGRRPSWNV